MSGITSHATLASLAKSLSVKDSNVAAPGRQIHLDLGDTTIEMISPSTQKRKAYHAVICTDGLLLAQIKKRTTFSRRSSASGLVWIPLRSLTLSVDRAGGAVQLLCVPPTTQTPPVMEESKPAFLGDKITLRLHVIDISQLDRVANVISEAVKKFNGLVATPSGRWITNNANTDADNITNPLLNNNISNIQSRNMMAPPPPPRPPSARRLPINSNASGGEIISNNNNNSRRSSSSTDDQPRSRPPSQQEMGFHAVLERQSHVVQIFARLRASVKGKENKEVRGIVEALRELVVTEAGYVQDLGRLVNVYMRPLLNQPPAVDEPAHMYNIKLPAVHVTAGLPTPTELQAVFGFVGPIAKVNKELLYSIQSRILELHSKLGGNTEEVINGDVMNETEFVVIEDVTQWIVELCHLLAEEFVRYVPFFKMYSVFCHQYTVALETLSNLRAKNKVLSNYLDQVETQPGNQQYALASLLIKPVQRICKYPLLFRALVKDIGKESEIREANAQASQSVGGKEEGGEKARLSACVEQLQAACTSVEEIAKHVNLHVSYAAAQDKVLCIFRELGGDKDERSRDLVQPARRLRDIFDNVWVGDSTHSENAKPGRVYMFNDLIIFAHAKTSAASKVAGHMSNALNAAAATSSSARKVSMQQRSVGSPGGLAPTASAINLSSTDPSSSSSSLSELRSVKSIGGTESSSDRLSVGGGGAVRPVSYAPARSQSVSGHAPVDPLLKRSVRLSRVGSNSGGGSAASAGVSQAKPVAALKLNGHSKLVMIRQHDDKANVRYCTRFSGAGAMHWVWFKTMDMAREACETIEEVAHELGALKSENMKNKPNKRAWTSKMQSNNFVQRHHIGTLGRVGESDDEDDEDQPTGDGIADGSGSLVEGGSTQGSSTLGGSGGSDVAGDRVSLKKGNHRWRRSGGVGAQSKASALLALASKYEVGVAQVLPASGILHYNVSFPEGALGFALESSTNIRGVIISCIAAMSVAEKGDVQVGDRLVGVGEKDNVPLNSTWEFAAELIKKADRPLILHFERSHETVVASERKIAIDAVLSKLLSGLATTAKDDKDISMGASNGSTGGSGMRRSLGRRGSKSGTAGELAEKRYSDSAKADELVMILKETCDDTLGILKKMTGSSSNVHGPSAADVIAGLSELIESEFRHVTAMRKVIVTFLSPLRDGSVGEEGNAVLSKYEETKIFMNIETLYKTNCELLKLWVEVVYFHSHTLARGGDIMKICKAMSDVFKNLLPFLSKSYAFYCSWYTVAMDTLKRLRMANPVLNAHVVLQEKQRADEESGMLVMLLIKPVHRISRYVHVWQLISDAVKACEVTVEGSGGNEESAEDQHMCAVSVAKALEGAIAAGKEMEEKVMAAENMETICQVLQDLGGEVACECEDLVKPTTIFVRSEDILMKVPPFNQSAFTECRMYVFNDVILLAKRREGVRRSISSNKGSLGGSNKGSLARRFRSLGKSSSGTGANGAASGTASESPFELTHRLNLDRRTVMDKLIRPASDDSTDQKPWHGFVLTHVKRVITQVPVSASLSSSGGLRGWGSLKASVSKSQASTLTQPREFSTVQKFQIRVKSEAVKCALQQCIDSLVVKIQEAKELSNGISANSDTSEAGSGTGMRKWASKKGANTSKYGTGKYGMKERATFGCGDTTSSESSAAGGVVLNGSIGSGVGSGMGVRGIEENKMEECGGGGGGGMAAGR